MRLLLAFTLAATATATAIAQQSAVPDVLGIRPGMPIADAYRVLKAHDPKGSINVFQTRIDAISAKPLTHGFFYSPTNNTSDFEFIRVHLTLPPSVQTVWEVTRTVRFPSDKQPLPFTLLTALQKKYGPELPQRTPDQHYWAFDQSGRPMRPGGAIDFTDCAMYSAQESNIMGLAGQQSNDAGLALSPENGVANRDQCHDYIYILASIIRDGQTREYVASITVSIVNPAIGIRAGRATVALANNAANADHQRELNKAKQQAAPPF